MWHTAMDRCRDRRSCRVPGASVSKWVGGYDRYRAEMAWVLSLASVIPIVQVIMHGNGF